MTRKARSTSVFTVSLYKLEGDLDFWLFIFHSDTQTAIHIQWNPNNKRFKLLTADYFTHDLAAVTIKCRKKMDSSTKFLSEMQSSASAQWSRMYPDRWTWRTHWGRTRLLRFVRSVRGQMRRGNKTLTTRKYLIYCSKSFVTELKVVEMSSFLSLPGRQKHLNVVSRLNPLIMK